MPRRLPPPYQVVFRDDPMGWTKFRDTGCGFGTVGAIHKGRIEGRPYRFANELICGRIAQFLLLPMPAFDFTYFAGQPHVPLPKAVMFSEIDFNCERDTPPLPDLDACVRDHPRLCAGILAFDILVANADRRGDHLWCDDPQSPKRLLMFDHDWTLFGLGQNAGIQRLQTLRHALGLGEAPDDNGHPFLERLPSARLLDEWYNRIHGLGSLHWFLEEVCRDAERYGISRAESKAVVTFLRGRSQNLERIIDAHRPAFTRVHDWKSGLFQ